jgi:hypothetical protein
MFCEDVQHHLRLCLNHLNCVKIAAFQFYLQVGKQKSRVGRGQQSCCSWSKNFLVKEEAWDCALLWCNSQFFCRQSLGQSLHTFSRSHHKMPQQYAELTVWPARANSLWTIPFMSKKIMRIPDFDLHLSLLFRSWWVWTFCVWLTLSCPNACLITDKVSITLFPRFAQNLMLFLYRTQHKIASGQTINSK